MQYTTLRQFLDIKKNDEITFYTLETFIKFQIYLYFQIENKKIKIDG